jgi:predicted DNA-binding protein (MmcQ/YjbR family)
MMTILFASDLSRRARHGIRQSYLLVAVKLSKKMRSQLGL